MRLCTLPTLPLASHRPDAKGLPTSYKTRFQGEKAKSVSGNYRRGVAADVRGRVPGQKSRHFLPPRRWLQFSDPLRLTPRRRSKEPRSKILRPATLQGEPVVIQRHL